MTWWKSVVDAIAPPSTKPLFGGNPAEELNQVLLNMKQNWPETMTITLNIYRTYERHCKLHNHHLPTPNLMDYHFNLLQKL